MRRSSPLVVARTTIALSLAAVVGPALAHHGVAGLGASGLLGPGAPIEAATSATLPAGTFLAYAKLDHARYKTFDPDPNNPESRYANYWMTGIGYGFRSWFSGYAFLPYHSKVDEPGGFDTHGFADLSLFGQLGLMYDEGLRLIPENESLDDMEDWHFTLFGGFTLPTGNPDLRDRNGEIDPGKSTGFGSPAYSSGSRPPGSSARASPSTRSSPTSGSPRTPTTTATGCASARRSAPIRHSSTASSPIWSASSASTSRWRATICIWAVTVPMGSMSVPPAAT